VLVISSNLYFVSCFPCEFELVWFSFSICSRSGPLETSAQDFYGSVALSVSQPKVSKHWRNPKHRMDETWLS